jgi:hypothetical protein
MCPEWMSGIGTYVDVAYESPCPVTRGAIGNARIDAVWPRESAVGEIDEKPAEA